MKIEFEAKFFIDLVQFKQKLESCGAKLVRSRDLMKRFNFKVPGPVDSWLRVRDEGEYVTLALKTFDATRGIDSLKELELKVSDFDTMVSMLQHLGYEQIMYAQNYREIYSFSDCLLMIDQWPALPVFVEIEGPTKEAVHAVATKLGFDMSDARYGTCALLYQSTYKISQEEFEKTKKITFENLPEWAR